MTSDTHAHLCIVCREEEPQNGSTRVCETCIEEKGRCGYCGEPVERPGFCSVCFPESSKAAQWFNCMMNRDWVR